jgi:hypothetical protein
MLERVLEVYAQKQLRLGIDIYSLSRLLGHETVNVTKVYLESIQDEEIVETGIKGVEYATTRGLNKRTRENT